MSNKRSATRKTSTNRPSHGKSGTIRSTTGHIGLHGSRPKIKTRTSIVGVEIFAPALPPRKISRDAFSAFKR